MTNNAKHLINSELGDQGAIYLPPAPSQVIPGSAVNVVNTLQKEMVVNFDSFMMADKPGSIVDFIIRKGSSELLIGVWPAGYVLTDDQIAQIERAGRSYICMLADFCYADTVTNMVVDGGIYETTKLGTSKIHTTYWVYHAKHGWIYDKDKKEKRI